MPGRTILAAGHGWLGGAALALLSSSANAFPPYNSTDADTADVGALQLRLGLLEIERTGSTSQRTTPLTRANFGAAERFEVVSEIEYAPDDEQLGEGALGFKWARPENGIGVETLILLPVQSDQSGSGLESQFIATLTRERYELHVNAGGFYDPRGSETERGWRASVLAEFPRDRWRPGLELFGRGVRSEGTSVQAGVGAISQREHFELRTGLHVGLTDKAPDVAASIWLAWSWNLIGQ